MKLYFETLKVLTHQKVIRRSMVYPYFVVFSFFCFSHYLYILIQQIKDVKKNKSLFPHDALMPKII